MNNPVARIIDANLNRAGEAIRTLEEYTRFIMDSAALAERCKTARHSLAELSRQWSASLPPEERPLPNRDIAGDVGATIKTETEEKRADAGSVAAAAFRRAEEALRVLSEYGKIDNAVLAAGFEKIRYEIYALEPLVLADQGLKRRLASARLYVLITSSLCSTDPITAAREAVAGGADMIQMREKEMEDREFHALAEKMAGVCRDGGALFIINDRPHIASLVNADGVHGGQGDLQAHLLRRFVGPDKIVGRSTSEPAMAENALEEGADCIGVGPVFETNTKKHRRAAGLEYVSWVANWGKLPFFAIGSINRDTIEDVIQAGARGIAICTAITQSRDIAGETAYFKTRMEVVS